jgi:hypothetical protein
MVLSDFECQCGNIHEALISHDAQSDICPACGDMARRIITLGCSSGSQEAPVWIKSVFDVIDKTDKRPHVREFLKHPTRSNYKNWMKGEGIKPVDYTEHGAPPVYQRPPEPDMNAVSKQLYERHRERQRIEVR